MFNIACKSVELESQTCFLSWFVHIMVRSHASLVRFCIFNYSFSFGLVEFVSKFLRRFMRCQHSSKARVVSLMKMRKITKLQAQYLKIKDNIFTLLFPLPALCSSKYSSQGWRHLIGMVAKLFVPKNHTRCFLNSKQINTIQNSASNQY